MMLIYFVYRRLFVTEVNT